MKLVKIETTLHLNSGHSAIVLEQQLDHPSKMLLTIQTVNVIDEQTKTLYLGMTKDELIAFHAQLGAALEASH